MTNIKSVLIDFPQIEKAESIEEVLCLSTLIATETLPPSSTVKDSIDFFERVAKEDCSLCPFANICLACIINE